MAAISVSFSVFRSVAAVWFSLCIKEISVTKCYKNFP